MSLNKYLSLLSSFGPSNFSKLILNSKEPQNLFSLLWGIRLAGPNKWLIIIKGRLKLKINISKNFTISIETFFTLLKFPNSILSPYILHPLKLHSGTLYISYQSHKQSLQIAHPPKSDFYKLLDPSFFFRQVPDIYKCVYMIIIKKKQ